MSSVYAHTVSLLNIPHPDGTIAERMKNKCQVALAQSRRETEVLRSLRTQKTPKEKQKRERAQTQTVSGDCCTHESEVKEESEKRRKQNKQDEDESKEYRAHSLTVVKDVLKHTSKGIKKAK